MNVSLISRLFVAVLSLLLLVVACKSSGETVESEQKPRKEKVLLIEKYSSFREAVRAQTKIMSRGNEMYLRSGMQSPLQDNQVRFAVKGQIIGTLSEAESVIQLNDVKKIRVLDGVEATSIYGVRGGNGVVEVILFDKQ